jgi:hypothetical protein
MMDLPEKYPGTQRIILPTSYCAPIEYFALISQHASYEIYIEQNETFPKQTWRNRCTLLTSQGLLNLSIPVKKPQGNRTITQNIKLINESMWPLKHWRAITSAYNASPYFLYYQDALEMIFMSEYKYLLEFNTLLTEHFLNLLNINTKLHQTNEYCVLDQVVDYRMVISPKKAPIFQDFPVYTQVFTPVKPFEPNLSILDLLFNLGPEAGDYLKKVK